MWRDKEEEKEKKTHEALRGATGSGNVTLGQSATGTTTLNGTTSVTTLNATTATSGLNLGNNSTSGEVQLANGSTFTGNIRIGAGSVTRTGTINIGTGGSGGISIGNSTCSVTLGPPLTLGSIPTAESTAQLGSYGFGTNTSVSSGTASYQALVTFTNLPIGIYIFNGGIFANTSGFSVNLQFGPAPTTQNSGLVNLCGYSGSAATVISFTTIYIQTTVSNVYFSAAGVATYQFVQARYVRIA